MDETTSPNIDQLKDEALNLGRRIGLLLASARMPDEQKSAWLTLIPSMDAQQMTAFVVALERFIPDEQEEGLEKLAKQLGMNQTKYAKQITLAADEAKSALDAIENEINGLIA